MSPTTAGQLPPAAHVRSCLLYAHPKLGPAINRGGTCSVARLLPADAAHTGNAAWRGGYAVTRLISISSLLSPFVIRILLKRTCCSATSRSVRLAVCYTHLANPQQRRWSGITVHCMLHALTCSVSRVI